MGSFESAGIRQIIPTTTTAIPFSSILRCFSRSSDPSPSAFRAGRGDFAAWKQLPPSSAIFHPSRRASSNRSEGTNAKDRQQESKRKDLGCPVTMLLFLLLVAQGPEADNFSDAPTASAAIPLALLFPNVFERGWSSWQQRRRRVCKGCHGMHNILAESKRAEVDRACAVGKVSCSRRLLSTAAVGMRRQA